MCTGTLLLQKEIYPQKSLPNLRQLIFLPLTKMGGASGAGSLLLNTKASQEAACPGRPLP